jgi:hypothetical protein
MQQLVSHTTCGTSQLFFHLGVPVHENAGSYVTQDVGYPEILHNPRCFDMWTQAHWAAIRDTISRARHASELLCHRLAPVVSVLECLLRALKPLSSQPAV